MFHTPAHKNVEHPPGQIIEPVVPAEIDPLKTASKEVEHAQQALRDAYDTYGIGRHWDAAYTRLQKAKETLNALLVSAMGG